jgi:LysM repeat protein
MQPFMRKVQDALRADLLFGQAQRIQPGARRLISALMAVVVIAAAVAVSAIPSVTNAANTNVIVNGSFESGFSSQDGCGSVGNGWNCFTNGGNVNVGFHDDSWAPVLADGNHAQLISLDTNGISNGDTDRYAGIYQTVRVVHGAPYTLNLRGMIRTTRLDGDPYRYVVQVGTSSGPYPNWAAVTNWQDTGWYTYYPREAPGDISSFSTDMVATDSYVTVYVRVWKKWASPDEELNVNLDGITLTGEAPYGSAVTLPGNIGGGAITLPGNVGVGNVVTQPVQTTPPVGCFTSELVFNGNFEQGFNPTVAGSVGKGWGFFTNGGRANFGFFDDQWSRVVADGRSSQLLAIDTRGFSPADGDRFIGIFQHVTRLVPGQTYEMSLKGVLRGEGPNTDPNRFTAQWGFNAGGNTDWMQVNNWSTVDLGPISERTDPNPPQEFRAQFVAPASSITLFYRGWSKWPVSDQEMNLNLDVISIRGCGGGTPPPNQCVYIVRPGDTLSAIAQRFGTTVHTLMVLNNITNPNIIFVGQQIRLPNCGVQPPPPVTPREHLVRPGDSLSGIARLYNVSVWDLARINGITNPNLIFVGQVLRIP